MTKSTAARLAGYGLATSVAFTLGCGAATHPENDAGSSGAMTSDGGTRAAPSGGQSSGGSSPGATEGGRTATDGGAPSAISAGGSASSGTAGSSSLPGDAGARNDAGATTDVVGLYRTFEKTIENTKKYANKFTDVTLKATFTAPSGKETDFFGFFDGDGNGGGNATNGSVWKLRFLPDELGVWQYTWSWSDGSAGGASEFNVVTAGAGKGVLRAYKNNPHWFAYNGTDPIWIKSYDESSHRGFAQPLDWMAANVYQPLIDNGYNHFQVDWLFPLCCSSEYYTDGPMQTLGTRTIYEEGKASSTMQLDIWKLLEDHLRWLNDKNVALHMFLGFDGGQNAGPAWDKLSGTEQDFYVRYVVTRLAPYANLESWNFNWEVDGSREA